MNKPALYIAFLAILTLASFLVSIEMEVTNTLAPGIEWGDPFDFVFGYLRASVGVFTSMFFVYLLFMWILEIPIFFIKRWIGKDRTILVYAGAVILLMLLHLGVIIYMGDQMSLSVLLSTYLPFFLLFGVYQWVFRGSKIQLEFADREALKMIVMLMGFVVITYGSWKSMNGTRSIEENYNVIFTSLNVPFAFAVAIGNLVFNISKELIKNRNSSKELALAKEDALRSKSELDTLQSGINPHFLYNSLNSIAALAEENPAQTKKMALSLSDFYKYVTNRGEKKLSSVAEELEMVTNYLEIEKIRFGEKLNYTVDVEENVLLESIPYFLLQPLLENAIKYGYNNQSDSIDVKLVVKKERGLMSIMVFDSGSPFLDEIQKGYGLRSVTKKLKLFYPDKHSIYFVNSPAKHLLIEISL